MEKRYQVIIVGGGPVGVALAVELGQRNISCAVVERQTAIPKIPKGQNLTNRTLEHFWSWNCVDELRAARVMPLGYPIGGVTAYHNLMSEYWYTPGRERSVRGPATDYYYQRNERLPQYCTEEVLRTRLKALPSATLLTGWNVDRVDQDDNGASVTLSPAQPDAFYSWSADTQQQTNKAADAISGEAVTLTADHVVGCDGGRSLVRESLGIDRGGTNFAQRMVLAVFRSKDLHQGLSRFPECTTYRVLKPELRGYWQFFGRIDVGEGFFFHAPVPAETRADNYDFQALLEDAAGFKFAADLDHVGFWDLRVMVASTYRRGRVFIAGDAAHQHPPYGGQGLNNGLEDARNLGWKLAANLQGWGGDGLLASYTDERRTVFHQIGQQMIAGGIERDREWLERHNPNVDKAGFEAAWKVMGESQTLENFDPHYSGSGVVAGAPGEATGIFSERTYAFRAGHHLAPKALTNGRNVYEDVGPAFTLLALGASDAAVGALEQAAKSQNVPLKVIRDTFEGDRQTYGQRLALVRPDQYVVWAGDEAPADAAALVKKVTGQT